MLEIIINLLRTVNVKIRLAILVNCLFEPHEISTSQIQESEEYQSLVKQHVDLETVHRRIVKGTYSSCTLGFYRDLLLLFNNAALFFPKSSLEFITEFHCPPASPPPVE
jgi:hypothetical protein